MQLLGGSKRFVPKVKSVPKERILPTWWILISLYIVCQNSEYIRFQKPEIGLILEEKKRSYRLFPKGTCRDIKKKLFDRTWIIFF